MVEEDQIQARQERKKVSVWRPIKVKSDCKTSGPSLHHPVLPRARKETYDSGMIRSRDNHAPMPDFSTHPANPSRLLCSDSKSWSLAIKHFAARGGDLVHRVALVYFAYLVRRTKKTRHTLALDQLPGVAVL